jgi:hypothetical protein
MDGLTLFGLWRHGTAEQRSDIPALNDLDDCANETAAPFTGTCDLRMGVKTTLTVTAAIGVRNVGDFRGFGVNGLSSADAAIESSQAVDDRAA